LRPSNKPDDDVFPAGACVFFIAEFLWKKIPFARIAIELAAMRVTLFRRRMFAA